MAPKPPAPYTHPSRRDQVPSEPRRKRQKLNHTGPKPVKKAYAVNELKSRIRSLKRLLERNAHLPATVRVEKERELQTVQHELAETERAKRRSEMIGRYHKVRFFDRQKASKRLKRARKELQAFDDGDARRPELEKMAEDAEVDVNYAQYYPLEIPYHSLFPRKKPGKHVGEEEEDSGAQDSGAGAVERQGDPEMWQRVKQCMADGTLDALRNGKLLVQSQPETKQLAADAVGMKGENLRGEGDREKPSEMDKSDDESDGGFFE